ncbi:MAG: ferrous iron transport protein B, partial [Candidatus Thermoplasmatota archaeon]|nr:ferrous iron transport protein B [Candidatus Thermoplasmatota archaeon]
MPTSSRSSWWRTDTLPHEGGHWHHRGRHRHHFGRKGERRLKIALAGNPNVGKTSLFNALTGARQHVGNWPGVTVEQKVGYRRHGDHLLEIVDLPGTYSLTANSIDEIVARDYIIDGQPDAVIHVVDATNLDRNLYLTTQLMTTSTRLVIALNKFDLSEARGDCIDLDKMEEFLEIPVVPTSASKGTGLDRLLDEVVEEATKGPHHHHMVGYGDDLERRVSFLVETHRKDQEMAQRYPLRWVAVKLLEGDENVRERISGSSLEREVDALLAEEDSEDIEVERAERRYQVIDAILGQALVRCRLEVTPSDYIDRVLTQKWLGIPIFLALMWGAFTLTFTVSLPFSAMIDAAFAELGGWISGNVSQEWLASLLADGIIGGVGFVLVFVPPIFVLFLLLSILEATGYLARAAFNLDRIMANLGLHGKSFIPLLMGFGCNVPAIMATRSIEDRTDRLITILVNPFMSCGARLPVYVLLAGAFFGASAGSAIFGIYVLGILVAVLTAKLLRKTLLRGEVAPFIMEMPQYQLPSARLVLTFTWERVWMYMRKAGTVILLGAIIVWLLASLPWGVEYGSVDSVAGMIGRALEPLFAPLGFDWRIVVALLFGFVAKELIAGT